MEGRGDGAETEEWRGEEGMPRQQRRNIVIALKETEADLGALWH